MVDLQLHKEEGTGMLSVPSSIQTAWLAGLLEGEGSFFQSSNGRNLYPVVQLNMTDKDIVERVASIFGTSVFDKKPYNPKHQMQYQVRVKGSMAVQIMKAIYPLMSERRKTQIDAALSRVTPGQ